MSSATAPANFSELYTDLLNRVREDTSVTATVTLAKRYINIGLIDMHIGFGEKFYWAHRHGTLRTQAPYSTGTVTITKGSTTLTGSSTEWDTDNDFGVANMRVTGKIVIAGLPEVYKVEAVASDTSATINTKFIGSDQSGASYVYFEDEYALASDFLRPYDLTSFTDDGEVQLIGDRDFRAYSARNSTTGKPRIATIVNRGFVGGQLITESNADLLTETGSGILLESATQFERRVRLWKPPDSNYLLPFTYITSNLAVDSSGQEQAYLTNDDDEPSVPLQYRHTIVNWALYNWYRDRKDDSRARDVKAEFTDLMLRISGDTQVGEQRPRLRPRIGPYARSARRPYSTGAGGRYATGSWFDELADRRWR